MKTMRRDGFALRGIDLRDMLPPHPAATSAPAGDRVEVSDWTQTAASDGELLALVAALEDLDLDLLPDIAAPG